MSFTIINEVNKILFNTSAENYFYPLIESIFPHTSLGVTKAKVLKIIKERFDVISVVLKPNGKFKNFIPGQYIEVNIKINAVRYTRIFSISSSLQQLHHNHTITLTIQRQKGGKVTNWIHDSLKVGDSIEISDPMGEFVLPKSKDTLIFIAGGSGITPFRSMLYQAVEENRKVTLLYYCNDKGEHLFENDFQSLHDKNLKIELIDSNSQGYISTEHIHKYCIEPDKSIFYICGPPPMLKSTQAILQSLVIDPQNIRFENFNPIVASNYDIQHIEGTVSILNSSKQSIPVLSNSSILETLENNGYFPKHGCRMGICKKCQCTKKKGVIYNKLTQKFSEATAERIEICTTIPVGNIELDFN